MEKIKVFLKDGSTVYHRVSGMLNMDIHAMLNNKYGYYGYIKWEYIS
ncbi:hypothetical protein [Elizabethkingia anophelis]|nr:hypothetical protein [Elizabethkingia anophelis]